FRPDCSSDPAPCYNRTASCVLIVFLASYAQRGHFGRETPYHDPWRQKRDPAWAHRCDGRDRGGMQFVDVRHYPALGFEPKSGGQPGQNGVGGTASNGGG